MKKIIVITVIVGLFFLFYNVKDTSVQSEELDIESMLAPEVEENTMSAEIYENTQRIINLDQVVYKDGLGFFEIGSNIPFSGMTKDYYSNGRTKATATIVDGLPMYSYEYYENGNLMAEINYKDLYPIFIVKNYYENGNLAARSEHNIKSEPHGNAIDYYEDGTIKSEEKYKDGEYHGIQRFYFPSGELKIMSSYKDGRKDGMFMELFENGQKKHSGEYKDAVANGIFKEYYENGNVKIESLFNQGAPIGYVRYYNEIGELIKVKEY